AKFMPPTSPVGIPSIDVVFDRAIIHGEDRGIKSFFVSLNGSHQMSPGMGSKVLPQHGGTEPVNHSIT
ncbi:hypothetical protein DFH07DRAFT_711517, partial [Mycena maculata]